MGVLGASNKETRMIMTMMITMKKKKKEIPYQSKYQVAEKAQSDNNLFCDLVLACHCRISRQRRRQLREEAVGVVVCRCHLAFCRLGTLSLLRDLAE